uniref:Lipoprotein n=1 Tax=Francisella tularensis subsp. novicida PA10-7858 TaxID=1386968 RepID=V5T9S1_FRANO|nr:hypothetical protein [Francisella tularensis]AHB60821.1 hypothetical protein N894_0053 [Francisella tularensis subsp. novicida PA10-7858]
MKKLLIIIATIAMLCSCSSKENEVAKDCINYIVEGYKAADTDTPKDFKYTPTSKDFKVLKVEDRTKLDHWNKSNEWLIEVEFNNANAYYYPDLKDSYFRKGLKFQCWINQENPKEFRVNGIQDSSGMLSYKIKQGLIKAGLKQQDPRSKNDSVSPTKPKYRTPWGY